MSADLQHARSRKPADERVSAASRVAPDGGDTGAREQDGGAAEVPGEIGVWLTEDRTLTPEGRPAKGSCQDSLTGLHRSALSRTRLALGLRHPTYNLKTFLDEARKRREASAKGEQHG